MEEYFNIIQSELLTGFAVAFQNEKGDLFNTHEPEQKPSHKHKTT